LPSCVFIKQNTVANKTKCNITISGYVNNITMITAFYSRIITIQCFDYTKLYNIDFVLTIKQKNKDVLLQCYCN